MIGSQTTYRPSGRIVIRRIGSDQLLVPVSGGMAGENAVFPLNPTGAFIWEQLVAGKTLEETAREMTAVFNVEFDAGRADCEEYIRGLLQQKLLEVAEP